MLVFVLFNSGVAAVQILRRTSLDPRTRVSSTVDEALSPAGSSINALSTVLTPPVLSLSPSRDRGRRLAETAFNRADAERASIWRALLERELELLVEETEMLMEDFGLFSDLLMILIFPSWMGRLRLATLRALLHSRRPRRFPYRLLLTAGPALVCAVLSIRG